MRLREMRLAAQLTQEAVAREAGLTKSYVQQLEAGRRGSDPVNPTLGALVRVASALGADAEELLNLRGEPETDASARTHSREEDEDFSWDAGVMIRRRIREVLADGRWHDKRKVLSRAMARRSSRSGESIPC